MDFIYSTIASTHHSRIDILNPDLAMNYLSKLDTHLTVADIFDNIGIPEYTSRTSYNAMTDILKWRSVNKRSSALIQAARIFNQDTSCVPCLKSFPTSTWWIRSRMLSVWPSICRIVPKRLSVPTRFSLKSSNLYISVQITMHQMTTTSNHQLQSFTKTFLRFRSRRIYEH